MAFLSSSPVAFTGSAEPPPALTRRRPPPAMLAASRRTGGTTKTLPRIPDESDSALPAPPSDDAVRLLYESAKREERAGNDTVAARMYESVVSLDATHGRAWVKRAMLERRKRNPEGAREVLMRALRSNPANAILWQALADVERDAGRVETARKLMRKALEANPSLPSVYHSWAAMEYGAGDAHAARSILLRGMRTCRPPSARIICALGVLEDRLGNAQRAQSVLSTGLLYEPDNPHLHTALGISAFRVGRIREARKHLAAAVRVDPRCTRAALARGRLEEMAGNGDVARKVYRGAARAGAVQIWQAWARLEEKAGRAAAAEAVYKSAVAAHPDDALLLCAWGKLNAARCEHDKAHALYEAAIAADGTRAYAWQCLALHLHAQGDDSDARAKFTEGAQRARGAAKERAALLHAHAAVEWELGNSAEARRLFDAAARTDASCGWIWLWCARFELEQGRTDLAKHYLARSINSDPKDGAPWRVWAEMERQAGDEGRARYMFKRAADLENARELIDIDPERPLSRQR